MSNDFKSGFVSVIGRPNVGKSTLINTILGQKISIIAPKPQTTRHLIRGIYTAENHQIIFMDTPGIHKPKHELGQYMNKRAFNSLKDTDLVLLVIDGIMDYGRGDEFVLNELKDVEAPVLLVINKIDLIKNKPRLMENVLKFTENYDFDEVLYVSSLEGTNIDVLMNHITQRLPLGPMYYPKDQVTDSPEEFIIAEIIREKVIYLTKEEVPHSVAVVVDRIEPANDDLVNIFATIYVERSSQKKIIIGKNGQMIKQIGTKARKEIVFILGKKVYLELWVKVEPDWRNKEKQLRNLGYKLEN